MSSKYHLPRSPLAGQAQVFFVLPNSHGLLDLDAESVPGVDILVFIFLVFMIINVLCCGWYCPGHSK
jgi:hypothetical protein